MGSIIPAWRIFAHRGASNWHMLAVLALGLLAAATLLAAAPIYARTMADLGLTFVIRDQLHATPSTQVQFSSVALQTAEGRALRAAVERRVDERIGWFRASQSRYLRAGRFAVSPADEAVPERAPLGQLQSLTGYEAHVRVTAGRMPGPVPPGEPIEVALGAAAAQASGITVGQQFSLNEDFDTCERIIPTDFGPPPPPCFPTAAVGFRFPARLVGVIEPLDAEDPFWVPTTSSYFNPVRVIPGSGPVLPMFADEASLLDGFGSLHRGYRADTAWNIFADPARLSRANFERARSDLRALQHEFEPLGGFAFSPLSSTLEGFGRTARYQQIPLTLLLLEIAGIAMFYVALMSAVIIERQAHEIVLFRSRGATAAQVVAMYLMEGLAIGIPVMLVAPPIAAAATALLGLTPAFDNVSDGALLPVTIPLLSFGMAAVGVVLSLLALVVPAAVVARRSAVVQRRSEARPGAGLIHRYYLDLALVVIAALLLWELRERGSVFTPSPTGGVSSDPLLLASPALVIAAAAALLLRFYPMILRLAARAVAAAAGVTITVGLWQLVRSPGQYTRLTLLLMMAVAVGTFAASYSGTADQSYRDRAAYEAGVEWRALGIGRGALGMSGADVDARLQGVPGVDIASAVIRTDGSLATPGSPASSVQVLGLDPAAARNLLWFRADFADRPLGRLLDELGGAEEAVGKELPGQPVAITVWVDTLEPREDVTLWARVRDSRHNATLLEFGHITAGWREMRAEVTSPFGTRLEPPFTLLGLLTTEPQNRFNTSAAPVFFDDVGVVDAGGQTTVIDDFESSPSPWAALPGRAVTQDKFEVSTEQAHSGRSAGKLTPRTGVRDDWAGLYIRRRSVPLPILASDSFVATTGLGPGASGLLQVGDSVVPVVVRGTFHLFPTLESRRGPAVIFNRDHLESWLGIASSLHSTDLNETWIQPAPGADRKALAATLAEPEIGLSSILDRTKALETIERNPLIAAGGGGILFVAFAAVLVLVAAALLVSLWTAVQRRRVEFAVLRTLGMSRGQVFRLLAFEYALVAFAGLAAGSYLGLDISRRMLSFLDVTENGAKVEPSFVLQTNWLVVLGGSAAVLGAFVVALVLATRALARTSDAQALRME